jgi:hypothetical protein
MAGTLNIPLTTLPIGTRVFGPASVADSDSLAVLSIDHTVANGFNSKTTATTCQISVHQSNDAGATWFAIASGGFPGGVSSNHAGQVNLSSVIIQFWPGTGRLTRAEVIIGGTSVAIQGSLTVS